MSDNNVRAVDVGYGNVKMISGRNQGQLTTKIFPAFAPKAAVTNLAGDFVRQRDTKVVVVNGIQYEVGTDSKLALKGNELGRTLRDDYCLSDQYRALVYGALVNMGRLANLDVLVLGLPVNTYQAYKDKLAKSFEGTFQISPDRTVTVNKCLVVPQPLGGFFDFAVSHNMLRGMSQETTLIVDPGYCTLDWLVAMGTVPIDARSGARTHGGMAEVLRDVVEQIATDAGVSVSDLGNAERFDNPPGSE